MARPGPRSKSGRNRVAKAASTLEEWERDQVIEWVAAGFTDTEIARKCETRGIQLTRQGVRTYRGKRYEAARELAKQRQQARLEPDEIEITLDWIQRERVALVAEAREDNQLRLVAEVLRDLEKALIRETPDAETIGELLGRVLGLPALAELKGELPAVFTLHGEN